MKKTLVLLAVMALASCAQPQQSAAPSGTTGSAKLEQAEMSAVATDAAAPADSMPPPPPEPGQPNLPPMTQQAAMIAYSYAMGLELPGKQVLPVRDAHLRACTQAGPSKCQLLGTSSNAVGKDEVTAELRLRGAPLWLEGFRAVIASDADKAQGRLLINNINSEDLTRQMVDTQATLAAQTKLRDRLTDLLARHQGKLGDLLEVERELARVQGEIDSRASELNVMRTRIAMSDLTVTYASEGVAVSDQTADPTRAALNDFLGIVSFSFAVLVRFIAGILPWLVILVPTGWAIRRWWRKRRAAQLARQVAGPATVSATGTASGPKPESAKPA